MAEKYRKAPITEAVIELRFEPKLPMERIASVAAKVRSRYPQQVEQRSFEFSVDSTGGVPIARHTEEVDGLRLSSEDQANVLVIGSGSLLTARLGSYDGWESFTERAKQNWSALRWHLRRRRRCFTAPTS
jgi:uncharacterized protein (TIGR04255 family)